MGSHTLINRSTMMKAVAALALFESVSAFQAPLASKAVRTSAPQMFSEGDIGVLPPLGVYDPLGLIETRDMRRYEIMEIKHGARTPELICRGRGQFTPCVACSSGVVV